MLHIFRACIDLVTALMHGWTWCTDAASVTVLLMFVPRHLIYVYTNCAYLCLCVHAAVYIAVYLYA